jgi:hypothetical protein
MKPVSWATVRTSAAVTGMRTVYPASRFGVHNVRVSFDLAVLAMNGQVDAETARAMFERCCSGNHADGELDERVVRFYEELRSRFPDYPPYGEDSPWMSTPLDAGIDHVIMQLSHSARSDPALKAITELAAEHDLVIWDPQSGEAHPPTRPS